MTFATITIFDNPLIQYELLVHRRHLDFFKAFSLQPCCQFLLHQVLAVNEKNTFYLFGVLATDETTEIITVPMCAQAFYLSDFSFHLAVVSKDLYMRCPV